MNFKFKRSFGLFLALILTAFTAAETMGQSASEDLKSPSARSDKLTGGTIEKTRLIPGDSDIKITVNVPAFQMTLWQNGKEVKTYWVGVGMKDYPIFIGKMDGSAVIWNPSWIPPNSDWVGTHKGIKAGDVILGSDPRNPLGRLKIPLGMGYLIHQAKGPGDLGSLVSHGCVRVMLPDLYDLAEKIVAARSLPVTAKQIAAAKASKKTLTAPLDPAIPVEITYDTMVVEAGKLHIYPDVYGYKTNTPAMLRAELKSSGVDGSKLSESEIEQMIRKAAARKQFVASAKDIENDLTLTNGKVVPVVGTAAVLKKPVGKRK
jgi:L,D-transpeptidase catalytic domain